MKIYSFWESTVSRINFGRNFTKICQNERSDNNNYRTRNADLHNILYATKKNCNFCVVLCFCKWMFTYFLMMKMLKMEILKIEFLFYFLYINSSTKIPAQIVAIRTWIGFSNLHVDLEFHFLENPIHVNSKNLQIIAVDVDFQISRVLFRPFFNRPIRVVDQSRSFISLYPTIAQSPCALSLSHSHSHSAARQRPS